MFNRGSSFLRIFLAVMGMVTACTAQPSSSPSPDLTSESIHFRTLVPSATQIRTRTPRPSATTTASSTPTPTPTPPPLQVVGWEGNTLHSICLEIQQSFQEMDEGFSLPIEEFVIGRLSLMGIHVMTDGNSCEANLTMILMGEPRGDAYAGAFVGYCYTGAMVRVHTILSLEGAETISMAITKVKPTPETAFGCPEKDEAPFREVWLPAISNSLFKLWGRPVWEASLGDEEWGEYAEGQISFLNAVTSQLPVLLNNLKDPDWKDRIEAADSIAEYGVYAQEAVPYLIDAIREDSHEVQETLGDALQEMLLIGSEAQQAIPVLIHLLQDDDIMTRFTAEETLGTIPEAIPTLIEALKNDDERIRSGAASALADFGPDAKVALPDLIMALKDVSSSVRFNAAIALGELGSEAKEAVPSLIITASDREWLVREYAVQALGKIGLEPGVIPALINALADQERSVRSEASDALGTMVEAVPALIEALRDWRVEVREGAAEALRQIGPEAREAVPALIEALSDTESSVRNKAALALGSIGPEAKEATSALIKALTDADHYVRCFAAAGLADIKPEIADAVPALIQTLREADDTDKGCVAEALADITEQDFGEDASQWEAWWQKQSGQ